MDCLKFNKDALLLLKGDMQDMWQYTILWNNLLYPVHLICFYYHDLYCNIELFFEVIEREVEVFYLSQIYGYVHKKIIGDRNSASYILMLWCFNINM